MKYLPLIFAIVLCTPVKMACQPNQAPTKKEQSTQPKAPPPSIGENNYIANDHATSTNTDSPKWYTALQRPDWWLVFIAGLTGFAIAYQAREMTRATDVMREQLAHTQESSERQLRAYVVMELGNITNIATPLPSSGITTPTDGRITHPDWGPVARIHIKNTGQTPAFNVRHWGDICFREYPLKSTLPTQTGVPMPCILGPGIVSTKLFLFGPPLTKQQIADLRSGVGAIYVFGEITYRDAFKKERFTHYRLMHHRFGGAIGISTELTFTEGGNEAE